MCLTASVIVCFSVPNIRTFFTLRHAGHVNFAFFTLKRSFGFRRDARIRRAAFPLRVRMGGGLHCGCVRGRSQSGGHVRLLPCAFPRRRDGGRKVVQAFCQVSVNQCSVDGLFRACSVHERNRLGACSEWARSAGGAGFACEASAWAPCIPFSSRIIGRMLACLGIKAHICTDRPQRAVRSRKHPAANLLFI